MEDILINVKNYVVLSKLFKTDLVSIDEILTKLENMVLDIDYLEEKIADMQASEESDDYENYIADVRREEMMIEN